MANTLHYSPQALKDLDEIYDYIFIDKQNPIATQNTVQGIKNSITELKTLDNIAKIPRHSIKNKPLTNILN